MEMERLTRRNVGHKLPLIGSFVNPRDNANRTNSTEPRGPILFSVSLKLCSTHLHHGYCRYISYTTHYSAHVCRCTYCVLSSEMSKQPRSSGPKVKTGCKTCKYAKSYSYASDDLSAVRRLTFRRIRRIKCDETKPSCLRHAENLLRQATLRAHSD